MKKFHYLQKVIEVKRDVEAKLLSQPGIQRVEAGYKVTDAIESEQLAILIFVTKKKSLRTIPREERIPIEINGVLTDVIELRLRTTKA